MNRRISVCLVVISVAAGLSLFPGVLRAQESGEILPDQPVAEGKPIFDQKGCGTCHGVGDSAGSKPGADLAHGGPWRDVMQFAGSLWNHAPLMVEAIREQRLSRTTCTPEEMGRLAAYLFYARFVEAPGTIEEGRKAFEERSCANCHQMGGRGGTVAPRLDELKDVVSAFFLAQALWNHGPEMAEKMTQMKVERPRLAGADVANIVAFVRGKDGGASPLAQSEMQAGSPRVGKVLFQDKGCTKCHAIDGVGGAAGPDLGQRRASSVAEMTAALWNHGPKMWTKMQQEGVRFPRLSEREMSDLLAYLHFATYVGRRGDAAKGAGLFRDKACAQCHRVGDGEAKAGSDLAASKAVASPLAWTAEMWNHAAAMEKKQTAVQGAWPRFEDDQMRDLVEFLRSRHKDK